MNEKVYWYTAALVILVAFVLARYARMNGYFFWRAFIFAILGLTMLAVMIIKTLTAFE